nr:hypothetical protein [uncultured Duganella sp.]
MGGIGRSNYLITCTDSGGQRAAAINSLIGTSKLNDLAPEAWPRHVQTHIATIPSIGWMISCLGTAASTSLRRQHLASATYDYARSSVPDDPFL